MNVTAYVWKQDSADWLTGTTRPNELACHKAEAAACPPTSFPFLAWVASAITALIAIQGASAQSLYVSDMSAGAVYGLDGAGHKTLIANGFGQPHGLAVDTAGNIYVAEVAGDRIRRITPSGAVETLYSFDSIYDNPEGVAIGPDGALYVSGTIDKAKNIYRIDPATGQATVYASAGLQECLDLEFDAAGNLYVADLASSHDGILWRVTPDGQASQFVTGVARMHGLAIAPDGETLYASACWDDEIWRIDSNGQATLFATMPSPWAMTFDNEGHLYVGSSHDGGQIVEFAPDGSRSVFSTGYGSVRGMDVPEPATLSLLALGGLALIRRRKRGACK